LDSARGSVAGAYLQVVGMDSHANLQQTAYQIFEVADGGRVDRFREIDLNGQGLPQGRAEAQRLAEKRKIQLEARGGKPTLTTRQVPQVVLYLQTGQGTLHAIDGENGHTIWSVQVGQSLHPSLPPAANDKYVATVNGSRLYLLERTTGKAVWDQPVMGNPSGGVRMDARRVFVPTMRARKTTLGL
jgi:hypothetical protein